MSKKTKEQIINLYKDPKAKASLIAKQLIDERNFPIWLTALENKKSIIVEIPNIGKLEYFVFPDYLAAGDENGFVFLPCAPGALREYMNEFDLILPTTKMVKQIYTASEVRPPVITNGQLLKRGGSAKTSSPLNIPAHSEALQNFLVKGKLTAGHKKDVVLTDNLLHSKYKDNVAIFGWFWPNGTIVQKLNFIDHDKNYFDYSHGLRMVYNACILNGEATTLKTIFGDSKFCVLVHDAPLKFFNY